MPERCDEKRVRGNQREKGCQSEVRGVPGEKVYRSLKRPALPSSRKCEAGGGEDEVRLNLGNLESSRFNHGMDSPENLITSCLVTSREKEAQGGEDQSGPEACSIA